MTELVAKLTRAIERKGGKVLYGDFTLRDGSKSNIYVEWPDGPDEYIARPEVASLREISLHNAEQAKLITELRKAKCPTAITRAELKEQREKGWTDFHPEDFCHSCLHANMGSWSVDSALWNEANVEQWVPSGIVCPPCFGAMYQAATGKSVGWQVSVRNDGQ